MALDAKEKVTPEGKETEDAFGRIMDSPDNADLRDNLNAAEGNIGTQIDTANENPMNFSKDDVSMADKPSGNKFAAWLGRNKWSVAGGGSAIILLGGLFTISAPLKLQGILSQLEDTTTGRLEGYIEKRTTRIFSQAILERFGIVDDRNIVKGGSLIKRLAKTMAANKYEERLAQKGIRFIANKSGDKVVSVSIELVGQNTDEAKALLKKAFKNADDLEAALQGNVVSKKILKSIIKQDLGVWGFLVRGKLTRWMMSYLGVKRFGTQKTDSNATAEDKIKTQAIDDITEDLNAKGKALTDGVDVMTTAENINGGATEVPTEAGEAAAKSSLTSKASAVLDEAKTAISSATSSTITKVVSEVAEKLGIKLAEGFAEKVGTKAIPVYGEVVLAATAVVFAHWVVNNTANGNAARAIALPAAVLMGFSYGKWAGYASQAKEGTLDTDLYNYFTPFLDGVETSSLFNCVNTNWQNSCDTKGEPAYKKLNETGSEMVTNIANMANTFGYAATGDFSPVYLLSRLIFNIDNLITGIAMDGIVQFIKTQYDMATFLPNLLIPQATKDAMKQQADQLIVSAGQFAMEGLLNIFGLNIGPTMGGNKLFDILLNGGTYTANRYMETGLAMHKIDLNVAAAQSQQYFAEQQEYDKSQGALYALFSPSATNSVTSRFISRTSFGGGTAATASNAVSSLFALVKSTPSSLADIVTNKAVAASYTSPEAVLNAIPFGITDTEANASVNQSVLNGEACATGSIGDSVASWFGINTSTENVPFDSCALDTAVTQSMLCSMDTSITETAECNPDAGGTTQASTGSSLNSPEECKSLSSSDPAQVWCKAFTFKDFTYEWGGGHGDVKALVEKVQSGAIKPPAGLADCSGLVSMAIYLATNGKVNQSFTTATIPNSKYFEQVSLKDAKTGDLFILRGGSHVEIFQSYTDEAKKEVESTGSLGGNASRKINTFGAHGENTDGGKISQLSPWYGDITSSGYPKVFRLKAEYLQ